MAFRRAAFDLWPGFHEKLGPGTPLMLGEEHHAFYSLIARGNRAVYSPDAVVRHPYPRTMEDLRRRQVRQLRAAMGYITLMLVEEADYRWPTLKYALEGLWGNPRTWRGKRSTSQRNIVPFWRGLAASFFGPFLYARARLGRSSNVTPRQRGELHEPTRLASETKDEEPFPGCRDPRSP